MEIIKLDNHLVAKQDLDAWVAENIDWLAEHGIETEIKSYRYELTSSFNGHYWRIDIFYTPSSAQCGSCDDELVPVENDCKHEWYRSHEVELLKLWEAR